jgi:hypothetical protein
MWCGPSGSDRPYNLVSDSVTSLLGPPRIAADSSRGHQEAAPATRRAIAMVLKQSRKWELLRCQPLNIGCLLQKAGSIFAKASGRRPIATRLAGRNQRQIGLEREEEIG